MANSFIQKELEELKKKYGTDLPGSELISCHPVSVRIRFVKTQHRQFDVCVQFSEKYPTTPIIIELKSKTIPEKLLAGLTNLSDEEAKKLLGKQQVLPVMKFLWQFLNDNPFTVCSEELSYIKKSLITDKDEIKTKQKSGVITMTINQDNYYFQLKFTVPEDYPCTQVSIEERGNNFPKHFSTVFISQAVELARRQIQPPLKKKPKDPPFEPKPSLKLVAEFLVKDCVRRYPKEPCQICKENGFPPDPKSVVTDESSDRFLERVYCAHLYHRGCLDTYMKTPPFTGGKLCPGCKQRIYHGEWNITPKLAEDRWAHKEAKRRELDEVVDFLE
ncbi:uncharacterized protein [Ptychodera flava]|uniref:uncharacterized protein n=1 Tax=Ptychodera flava TaxID=63121 RepID=UPI00396A4F18